ncbi:MAG: HD domain-containing protein [Anaerohalosphaeraceae bacterium]
MDNPRLEIIAQAESFADRCGAEREHRQQVHRLSMKLFDLFAETLKLDESDRFILQCAAILHDIGWCTGQQGHHKQSMRMILEDATLPLTPEERTRIALTARYHRKSLPKNDHPVYSNLRPDEQKRIAALAALLRIADGLDSSHQSCIQDIQALRNSQLLILSCRSRQDASEEMQAAQKKSDLLAQILAQPVKIVCEAPR